MCVPGSAPRTIDFLSFAGRVKLICSVVHILTNFWISIFPLLKQCIQQIDRLCAVFLSLNWRQRRTKYLGRIVSYRGMGGGGLGLKSIAGANKVSCLKLIWKLLSSPSSLWVTWVNSYLIRKGSLWSVKENIMQGSWTEPVLGFSKVG